MSSKPQGILYEVRPTSVQLGDSAYPFSSIARLSVAAFKKRTLSRMIGVGFGVLLLLILLASDAPAILNLIVFLVVAYRGFRLYRDFGWREYHLVIETAGSPAHVLTSNKETAITDLRNDILSHMDNPPTQPITQYLDQRVFNKVDGDVVGGDKIMGDKYS